MTTNTNSTLGFDINHFPICSSSTESLSKSSKGNYIPYISKVLFGSNCVISKNINKEMRSHSTKIKNLQVLETDNNKQSNQKVQSKQKSLQIQGDSIQQVYQLISWIGCNILFQRNNIQKEYCLLDCELTEENTARIRVTEDQSNKLKYKKMSSSEPIFKLQELKEINIVALSSQIQCIEFKYAYQGQIHSYYFNHYQANFLISEGINLFKIQEYLEQEVALIGRPNALHMAGFIVYIKHLQVLKKAFVQKKEQPEESYERLMKWFKTNLHLLYPESIELDTVLIESEEEEFEDTESKESTEPKENKTLSLKNLQPEIIENILCRCILSGEQELNDLIQTPILIPLLIYETFYYFQVKSMFEYAAEEIRELLKQKDNKKVLRDISDKNIKKHEFLLHPIRNLKRAHFLDLKS